VNRKEGLRWRTSTTSASAQERVRGVTRLRVVDASVLPVQVADKCQAPTMAVAWIAADLILQGS
jgi:choline dehydrogenase-like flavoprotein